MAKKAKHFSKQFKQEAVAMTQQKGVTVVEVARQLGIRPKLLYNWRSAFLKDGDDAFPGTGHQTPENAELARLRRENAQLKMERDILKKAMRVIITE